MRVFFNYTHLLQCYFRLPENSLGKLHIIQLHFDGNLNEQWA